MLTIDSTDTFSTIFLGDIARIITFFGAAPEFKKDGRQPSVENKEFS